MLKVIGVRFRNGGKVYYFDPAGVELKREDQVIVETSRGVEIGTVLLTDKEVKEEEFAQQIKPIIRKATDEDLAKVAANIEKEKEALKICEEKVVKHSLDMKIKGAEYTFDNSKLVFYFTADGRIDFRELVKDLAGVFHTRIELRQIGVRDETKLMGGLGICGRELCCKSFLGDFGSVSIKMAKEQNLSLNPTKISGLCGRLMCCLKYEQETYEYLNSRLPMLNDFVKTPDGKKGQVRSINVLRQLVEVVVEEGDTKEAKEYKVEELHFSPRKKKINVSKEELKELKSLEGND